jgi:uncharacterized RDD family membrane protein YckC
MTEQQPSLDDSGPPPEIWRNEVQARLERYKRRRGRRIEGAFTMRFPFPTEESPAAEQSPGLEPHLDEQPIALLIAEQAIADQSVEPEIAELSGEQPEEISSGEEINPPEAVVRPSVVASAAVPARQPEPVIELPPRPRPRPRRKVIAFPVPAYAPSESNRRLADPVQPEQLRILDVPEELQAMPASPFLEGLLDAPPAPGLRADVVELPCAPVGGARRSGAALVDLVVVLAGVGVCAAVASRFLTELPSTKFVVGGAAAVSVMLWASYQYLFLVFGGRTLGMRAAHVRLQTFKGRPLDFPQRRLRVVGLYLSVLSLGMGVLWHFVDVDSLCWHDRISQTFPVAADKS